MIVPLKQIYVLEEKTSTPPLYTVYVEKPEYESVNLLWRPGIDTQPGGTDSLESILGLLKRFQTRALM